MEEWGRHKIEGKEKRAERMEKRKKRKKAATDTVREQVTMI